MLPSINHHNNNNNKKKRKEKKNMLLKVEKAFVSVCEVSLLLGFTFFLSFYRYPPEL